MIWYRPSGSGGPLGASTADLWYEYREGQWWFSSGPKGDTQTIKWNTSHDLYHCTEDVNISQWGWIPVSAAFIKDNDYVIRPDQRVFQSTADRNCRWVFPGTIYPEGDYLYKGVYEEPAYYSLETILHNIKENRETGIKPSYKELTKHRAHLLMDVGL